MVVAEATAGSEDMETVMRLAAEEEDVEDESEAPDADGCE